MTCKRSRNILSKCRILASRLQSINMAFLNGTKATLISRSAAASQALTDVPFRDRTLFRAGRISNALSIISEVEYQRVRQSTIERSSLPLNSSCEVVLRISSIATGFLLKTRQTLRSRATASLRTTTSTSSGLLTCQSFPPSISHSTPS